MIYRPAEPWADVELRMDGLRRHRDVTFRVETPEPWAPRWEGRLQGQLSEFVTLRDGAHPPAPLDAAGGSSVHSRNLDGGGASPGGGT